MRQCWFEDPLKRPTFLELGDQFERLISTGD